MGLTEADARVFLTEGMLSADLEDHEEAIENFDKALQIIENVEKKINKIVFSSNQTLIWDTIRSVGYKSSIEGYGKLFRN